MPSLVLILWFSDKMKESEELFLKWADYHFKESNASFCASFLQASELSAVREPFRGPVSPADVAFMLVRVSRTVELGEGRRGGGGGCRRGALFRAEPLAGLQFTSSPRAWAETEPGWAPGFV